jgi:hypothetical protein
MRLWLIAIFLLVAPIFFYIDSVSEGPVMLFDAYSEVRASLSISVIVVAACSALAAVKWASSISGIKKESFVILLLMLATTVSYLIGYIFVDEWQPLWSTAAYAQTIYAIAAFWMPFIMLAPKGKMSSKSVSINDLVFVTSLMLGFWVIGHVLSTLFSGVSDIFSRFSVLSPYTFGLPNLKFKRLFPVICAAFAGAAFVTAVTSRKRSRRFWGWLMLGLFVLVAVVSWSRTAILCLLISITVAVGLTARHSMSRLLLIVVPAITITAIAAVLFFGSRLNQEGDVLTALARVLDTVKLLSEVNSAELGVGDRTRLESFSAGVRQGLMTPLGTHFEIELRAGQPRVLTTESGILDVAVRSGGLGVFLLLSFYYIVVRRLRRSDLGRGGDGAVVLPVICALIFASMFINIQSDPYTGPLFWFVFGLATCVKSRREVSDGEASTCVSSSVC